VDTNISACDVPGLMFYRQSGAAVLPCHPDIIEILASSVPWQLAYTSPQLFKGDMESGIALCMCFRQGSWTRFCALYIRTSQHAP
jgi:hypothetical protein